MKKINGVGTKCVHSGDLIDNRFKGAISPIFPSTAYDFIDVEDVARCNICSLSSDSTDEFYNVGTGVQTTIKELCDTILELKESKLKVTFNPYSEDDARLLVQNRI